MKYLHISTHQNDFVPVAFQDRHDTMLELERMKQLDMKALIIQRVLRGYKYRYDTKVFHSYSVQFSDVTHCVFISTPSKGENS